MLVEKALSVDSILTCRAILKQWKVALLEKRKRAWQDDMRKRMGQVRKMIEGRIQAEAFIQWTRKHAEIKATRFNDRRLLTHTLRRWSRRLQQVDELAIIADQVVDTRNRMDAERVLATWRTKGRLQETERVVGEMHSRKVVANAFRTWRDTA